MRRRAGRANGDPSFILLGLVCVLDEGEAELADVEGECLVIIADEQGDVGEMGHGDHIDIVQTIVHTWSMQTITYSEARDNLKGLMDKAAADRAPILITRQRGENVVIISAEEWAGMEETLHLLASPANAKHLLDGIKELDAGRGEVHELIKP